MSNSWELPKAQLKNLNDQKETPAPEPSLLDVVIIDGRLAQVSFDNKHILFLDEKSVTSRISKLQGSRKYGKLYKINWKEYDYEKVHGASTVGDLRDKGEISDDEYMTVHWGPEEKADPYMRDGVIFFGKLTKKK